jgi:hypothetical protein
VARRQFSLANLVREMKGRRGLPWGRLSDND